MEWGLRAPTARGSGGTVGALPRLHQSEPIEQRTNRPKVPSEIMNYFGRKGDPQGVQHGQNVDDFLGDGTAHRT
jgi:hypothetical protein